ncbi:MAG: type III pantothenate kinase [Bacteroidaceae bacterium]|nr:type III pantothenate kinase [Bacteroidaceae bacterium]
MNLIADIGNNSAKFFLFNGEQILLHTRRGDASYGIISEWNEQFGIDKIIVSTVIDLTEQQKEEFHTIGCPVIWFNNDIPTPLSIEYATPHTLGSDRIAAAVGAWNEQPGNNMLVIDAGSAITIDFVDRQGRYKGGNIAPGVKMRLKALHEFTGRLPLVEKEGETPTFGYDTKTAIRSGVIKGICHEIDGYINEIREKYGNVLVFLTGGDEKTLKNSIKNRIFADKYLVAKGLNRILLDYDWL